LEQRWLRGLTMEHTAAYQNSMGTCWRNQGIGGGGGALAVPEQEIIGIVCGTVRKPTCTAPCGIGDVGKSEGAGTVPDFDE
jgi:hypothetical protein